MPGEGSRAKLLHSRYNPQAEAARYIDSLRIKEATECFILIEPGLGYMIPVLREKFKECKIIALHIEKDQNHDETTAGNFTGCSVFHGTERKYLIQFLEKEVSDNNTDSIRIIEWRPSLNYYKEDYILLLSHVVNFLKRVSAEKRTAAHFGKRWFRNFFRNFLFINKTVLYKQTYIPVIITGSGPGLEQAMPLILQMQDNCLIIAASSSVMALCSFGIKADIVIATDGGNWALKHLTGAYRSLQKNQLGAGIYTEKRSLTASNSCSILAANLCAALPSQSGGVPFLIISDGSFWQSVILRELNFPSVIIPERGTVTAAAVDLAAHLSGGSIYLAGMDLSNNDIRTHAKPYAFDSIFFGNANRIHPFYSISYTRASLLKEGGSMDIYAQWFKDHTVPRQIFSLTENNIFIKSKPEKLKKQKNKDEIFSVSDVKNAPSLSGKKTLNALFSAMRNPQYGDKIKKELTSLLSLENEKYITEEQIIRELRVEN